ncbi:MAG: hypothetical protein QGH51_04780 [Planctomycetota bacterium]|nr:hypothetical protein [Planctomycetota bacterium]MDP6941327.1 hypothetical protein [Planctomycetota bacterium]
MNQSSPLVLVLVAILGGVFGAWFVNTVGQPVAPESSLSADLPALAGEASEDNLAQSVSALQVEVDLLRNQLESRKPLAPAHAPVTPMGDIQDRGPSAGLPPTPPEIRAELNALLEEREVAQTRERAAREEERRQERLDRQMTEWQEKLGLNDAQALQMRDILADSSRKRSELFTEMREGGGFDREYIREQMQVMRDSTNDALSNVLFPDQFSTYQEESENSRGFGGRGGRGSGGSGGSGGGRPF